MSVSTFSSDFVHTALIQMGANQIKVVSGKQMVITFDLGNGLDLVYVLSVSNENKCFLQRARPYPMVHGKFASTEEILPFIERDYHAFLNARNSRNYGTFVDVTRKTLALTQKMEELFITHNLSPDREARLRYDLTAKEAGDGPLSPEDLALLHAQCDQMDALMKEVAHRSPEIYCEL